MVLHDMVCQSSDIELYFIVLPCRNVRETLA